MAKPLTARRLSKTGLIAPCGMNCGLCSAYLRTVNRCPGCRTDDGRKPKTRVRCKIKNCQTRRGTFCSNCAQFPCARLSHLDKRYRTKYGMSMIENLRQIKTVGVRNFSEQELAKWACPGCGSTICVHKDSCLRCHRPWR